MADHVKNYLHTRCYLIKLPSSPHCSLLHLGHVPSEHTTPAPDRDQNIDDKTHKKHNIHKTEKTHTTHKKHNTDNTGKTHKTHKKETVVRYIGF